MALPADTVAQPNEVVSDTSLTPDELHRRAAEPAHVIGTASAEGVAVARLLLRLGFSRVVLHDSRPREQLRKVFRTTHGAYTRVEQDKLWTGLAPLLERGRFGDDYLAGVAGAGAGTVVLGQGWYLDEPNRRSVLAALPPGCLLTSMTELYLALAPGPVAAVTGTNGKSTTVALCAHLLAADGVAHACAGNERSSRQFLPEILDLPAGTLSLLEISNRQLLQVHGRSPQVAAITALTPDHLTEHGGAAGYAAAKARLFAGQGPHDVAIANADDVRCLAAASAGQADVVRCGLADHDAPSVRWIGDDLVATQLPLHDGTAIRGTRVVARRGDLRMPGEHNLRNAAVAVAVALACGASVESIGPAMREFTGTSLRLELVATLGDGIEIYNDVKSTTPEAAEAALAALAAGHSTVIVAGGDDKGLDYSSLAGAIADAGVAVVVVPGSATDALVRELALHGIEAHRRDRLADALPLAVAMARDRSIASQSAAARVIVSPAAAGFWTSQLQGQPSIRTLAGDIQHADHATSPQEASRQ